MINADVKRLFDWFSDEYPNYNLTLSNAPNGVIIKISYDAGTRTIGAQKDLMQGRELFDGVNVYDVVRANIPAVVAALRSFKTGV